MYSFPAPFSLAHSLAAKKRDFGRQKEGLPDAPAPPVLRDMKAGQIKVSLFPAKEAGLHRREALQAPALKGRSDEPACFDGIFQAGNQELIVLLCPVVHKGGVPDDPFPLFPPPAFCHHLY